MLYRLARFFLFFLDAEKAHYFSVACIKILLRIPVLRGMLSAKKDSKQLSVTVFGLTFSNPIGLAAGFDKNASSFEEMGKLGFSFVEIGIDDPLSEAGVASDQPESAEAIQVPRDPRNAEVVTGWMPAPPIAGMRPEPLQEARPESLPEQGTVSADAARSTSVRSDVPIIDDSSRRNERGASHRDKAFPRSPGKAGVSKTWMPPDPRFSRMPPEGEILTIGGESLPPGSMNPSPKAIAAPKSPAEPIACTSLEGGVDAGIRPGNLVQADAFRPQFPGHPGTPPSAPSVPSIPLMPSISSGTEPVARPSFEGVVGFDDPSKDRALPMESLPMVPGSGSEWGNSLPRATPANSGRPGRTISEADPTVMRPSGGLSDPKPAFSPGPSPGGMVVVETQGVSRGEETSGEPEGTKSPSPVQVPTKVSETEAPDRDIVFSPTRAPLRAAPPAVISHREAVEVPGTQRPEAVSIPTPRPMGPEILRIPSAVPAPVATSPSWAIRVTASNVPGSEATPARVLSLTPPGSEPHSRTHLEARITPLEYRLPSPPAANISYDLARSAAQAVGSLGADAPPVEAFRTLKMPEKTSHSNPVVGFSAEVTPDAKPAYTTAGMTSAAMSSVMVNPQASNVAPGPVPQRPDPEVSSVGSEGSATRGAFPEPSWAWQPQVPSPGEPPPSVPLAPVSELPLPKTAARLQELLSGEVVLLQRLRTGSMTAVLRPDPGSELRVELRRRQGSIEIRATVERGDARAIAEGWPELQQQLRGQGIHLFSLERSQERDPVAPSQRNASGNIDDHSSPSGGRGRQQPPSPEAGAWAQGRPGRPSGDRAPSSTSGASTSRTPHRLLESWA